MLHNKVEVQGKVYQAVRADINTLCKGCVFSGGGCDDIGDAIQCIRELRVDKTEVIFKQHLSAPEVAAHLRSKANA